MVRDRVLERLVALDKRRTMGSTGEIERSIYGKDTGPVAMRDLLSGLVDVRGRSGHGDTLTRQLYDQLRQAISTGSLAAGNRLPSSRDLARQLGVSRNTVSVVMDQLAMEGYLDIAQGRCPTVAVTTGQALQRGEPVGEPRVARISRWGEHLRDADWPFVNEGSPRPFMPGLADAREFPREVWARCLRRAARKPFADGPAVVNRPLLRAALLKHLMEQRGVRAVARQIMIMPSAQAAIEIIARVMLDMGDLAWVESPGYGGARAALEAAGARVRGIRLDDDGLLFRGRSDRPRLIFVTPSHQYPTGRLMPINRRRELLAFATSSGAAVIEDDYDSEFHYDGRPIAALQGIDDSGSVFYVGTFSKSMFADVRAGYAVVPVALVDVFEKAQRHSGQIVSAVLQDALAAFIDEGHFVSHIRRMTRIYRDRRNELVRALSITAGHHLRIASPAGGMQLLAYIDPKIDDAAIAGRLAEAGVTVRPLSPHFVGGVAERGLFLGFAAWNESEIDAGAAVIGQIMWQLGDVS